MFRIAIAAFALAAIPHTATAQSSSCRWIGTVWNCDYQSAPQGIDWSILNQSQTNPADSFRIGAEIGGRIREQRERKKIESELVETRRQLEQERAQRGAIPAADPAAPPPYFQAWFNAAQKRSHLYSDFREVVFAPDAPITPQMVMLMSVSPYAADIAYYLASHRSEALAISQLPLVESGRAIDRIEAQFKAKDAPLAPPQEAKPKP